MEHAQPQAGPHEPGGPTTRKSLGQALILVASLAAVGVIAGIWLAARDTAQQQYLLQGLWRVALWNVSHHALRGGLLGGLGGLVLLGAFAGWRWRACAVRGASLGAELQNPAWAAFAQEAIRFAIFVAIASGAAAFFIPADGPERFHVPYVLAVVACFAALWLLVALVAVFVAATPSRRDSGVRFRLVWLALVGLGCVIVILHAWARTAGVRDNVLLVGCGLLGAGAAYLVLQRPVGFLIVLVCRGVHLASRNIMGIARMVSIVVLALAAGLWATSLAIRSQATAQAAQRGQSVLLVVVDTVRWDSATLLSSRENGRDVTPNLRTKLAARGAVYGNAITQAPWTLPAVASIVTGLYPEQHGAQHLIGSLRPEQVTLAEMLREEGLCTMGVISVCLQRFWDESGGELRYTPGVPAPAFSLLSPIRR